MRPIRTLVRQNTNRQRGEPTSLLVLLIYVAMVTLVFLSLSNQSPLNYEIMIMWWKKKKFAQNMVGKTEGGFYVFFPFGKVLSRYAYATRDILEFDRTRKYESVMTACLLPGLIALYGLQYSSSPPPIFKISCVVLILWIFASALIPKMLMKTGERYEVNKHGSLTDEIV